jgi:hypothetical protein
MLSRAVGVSAEIRYRSIYITAITGPPRQIYGEFCCGEKSLRSLILRMWGETPYRTIGVSPSVPIAPCKTLTLQ